MKGSFNIFFMHFSEELSSTFSVCSSHFEHTAVEQKYTFTYTSKHKTTVVLTFLHFKPTSN